MSAGSLLAFFRAFSAFLASRAALACAFASAALALVLLSAIPFTPTDELEVFSVAVRQRVPVEPAGPVGGPDQRPAEHAGEPHGPGLVGQLHELLRPDPAVHRQVS